jgi:hypothetical protein
VIAGLRGRGWWAVERGRVDFRVPARLIRELPVEAIEAIVAQITARANTEVSRKIGIPLMVVGVCAMRPERASAPTRFIVFWHESGPFEWMIEAGAVRGSRVGTVRANVRAWLRQNAKGSTRTGWRWLDTDRLSIDDWRTMFRLSWC